MDVTYVVFIKTLEEMTMKKHESNVLTNEELDSLVYLLWNAPALFSYEGLDDEYLPLVQKGYAYVEEVSAIAPFSICVRITQKGKEAVLKEEPICIIGACAREGLLSIAERIVKRLPMEQLPELLTFNESQRMYIRLYATKRLEQLNEREKPKEQGGSMDEPKVRTVRLLSCDLIAPGDLTKDLSDHKLSLLWYCSYDGGERKHRIKPEQAMYDFNMDDEVPGDWLVWTETEHMQEPPPASVVSVMHDLRVLQRLGVRGSFVINEVDTMVIEKWELLDHFICTHTREVTFEGDPDSKIPVTDV